MNYDEALFEQIQTNAIRIVSQQNAVSTNLYIQKKILFPGDVIKSGNNTIPVKKETIYVFADDEPLLNWGHKCRFMLFDAQSNKLYHEENVYFPPYLIHIPDTYNPFFEQAIFPEEVPQTFATPSKDGKPLRGKYNGERYAVLFSGASNQRHLADLQIMYNSLLETFGFRPENIYVLNYDGKTNYSSFEPVSLICPIGNKPYSIVVNAQGTRSELDSAFDDIKKRIKAEDMLFIHTNNHGDGPGFNKPLEEQTETESSLVMFNDDGRHEVYYAEDFASKLSQFPKFQQLTVMMEQCHSGGFMDPVIKKSRANQTCFSAACKKDRTSLGGKHSNPFSFNWTLGLHGESHKTIHDAFEFAKTSNDCDTPIIADFPEGCRKEMVLGS